MKKSISLYGFIILALSLWTNAVFAIPTLTEASATGTTVKFVTKLSEKLPTGYKVKIDLNNGKGLVAMTCSGLTCSLSSNALPKLDSLTYKIGIYDAKGILQSTLLNGTFVMTSIAITSKYTKISNSGAVLPDIAKLGFGLNDWACTKDNETGLIWEVKTTDGGLRDWNNTYTNYSSGLGYLGSSDAQTFVNEVNNQKLCGATNWDLPSLDALKTLIFCSDGQYDEDGSCKNYQTVTQPTIMTTYFPNTQNDWYWSWNFDKRDPAANPLMPDYLLKDSTRWSVNFYYGYFKSYSKDYGHYVRLVHY
ncbi:MAG: hypothetical protein RLZZ66_706 [Pseudomonadota bacterium]|jgi:hypothetical protein